MTTPDAEPTDATVGLVLVQRPPGTELESVMDDPEHRDERPDIAVGVGSTVTAMVARQPVDEINVIVPVPVEMPVPEPVADPIETKPEELLQVPLVDPPQTIGPPTQMLVELAVAETAGFTVIVFVTIQPKPNE